MKIKIGELYKSRSIAGSIVKVLNNNFRVSNSDESFVEYSYPDGDYDFLSISDFKKRFGRNSTIKKIVVLWVCRFTGQRRVRYEGTDGLWEEVTIPSTNKN